MFAIAQRSKTFRIVLTAVAAATLTICGVAVTTHESGTPTAIQLADGTTPAPTLDGFHW